MHRSTPMRTGRVPSRGLRFLVLLAATAACSGDQAAVPPQMDSGFDFTTEAFTFANFADNASGGDLSPYLAARMLGRDAVCIGDGPDCPPKAVAETWIGVVNQTLAQGRSEGFAVTALLMHMGELDPEDFGASSAAELTLQGNLLLQEELAYWSATQSVPGAVLDDQRFDAASVMPFLARALAPDSEERYRLAIAVRTQHGFERGHALVPIGYTLTEQGDSYRLRVYDSNFPEREREIEIDPARNTWRYEVPLPGETLIYEGTGDNGNFLHFSPVSQRLGVLPSPFDMGGTTATLTASGGVEAVAGFDDGASAGIRDGQVVETGGGRVTPAFANCPLCKAPTGLLNLTLDNAPAETLKIAVSGTTAEQAGGVIAMTAPGLAARVEGVSGTAGEQSELAVSPNGKVTFASEGSSRVELTASSERMGVPTTISVEVRTPGGAVTEVSVEFDREGNAVINTKMLPEGTTLRVTIDPEGMHPQDTWVQLKGEDSTTLTIDPETMAFSIRSETGDATTGTCFNERWDEGETDLDCGGLCKAACGLGKGCKRLDDCDLDADEFVTCELTGMEGGLCTSQTCSDAKHNRDETDVDCGGSCEPCGAEQRCMSPTDCHSGVCRGDGACSYSIAVEVRGVVWQGPPLMLTTGGEPLDVFEDGPYTLDAGDLRRGETVTIESDGVPDGYTCRAHPAEVVLGGDSLEPVAIDCERADFMIGGDAQGLVAPVELSGLGPEALVISDSGPFARIVRLDGQTALQVEVTTDERAQTCSVSPHYLPVDAAQSDSLATALSIRCEPETYLLRGRVEGFGGGGLVLRDRDSGEMVPVAGDFSLPRRYPFGHVYSLEIASAPASHTCELVGGEGSVTEQAGFGHALTVECELKEYALTGQVTGARSAVSVSLDDGPGWPVDNGSFSFPDPLTHGDAYQVTVVHQPTGQTCSLSDAVGTIDGTSTPVRITCQDNGYRVGGTVTGLLGSLTLQNHGGSDLTVNASGSWQFPQPVAHASDYAVAVVSQPNGQTCSVGQASGTVAAADVTNVSVSCINNAYSLGGSVNGLVSGTVTLTSGTGQTAAGLGNGPFSFGTPVAFDSGFDVRVTAAAPGHTCVVANGTGTVGAGNVTQVSVNCAPNSYTVGGTVTGLSGTLTLQNQGATTAIGSSGSFTLAAPVTSGGQYTVSVSSQPAGQTCSVSQGSGTVTAADITSIQVTCSNNLYTLGGNVTGIVGGTLSLTSGTGQTLSGLGNGGFSFSSPIAFGTAYAVQAVAPAGHTCVVSNGSGTLPAGGTSGVSIVCGANAYAVGGSVSGLNGTLSLTNNQTDTLQVSADGSFTFPTPVSSGQPYDVSVSSQPAGQTCLVSQGQGTVAAADISTVSVSCTNDLVTLAGTVTGLSAGTMTLTSGTGETLNNVGNGPFSFGATVAFASSYDVQVATPVPGYTCIVSGGTGSMPASGVSTVTITCAADSYAVGGDVSGLTGSVTLRNNGGDSISLGASGSFTFPTPVLNGGSYAVTVSAHPAGQTCRVVNGSGVVNAAAVSNVSVLCDDGLIASYDLDAGSGTSFADGSGKGRHATTQNGSWQGGYAGNGYRGWAISDNPHTLANRLTVAMWINIEVFGPGKPRIVSAPGDAFEIGTASIGTLDFFGHNQHWVRVASGLPTNRWVHIAFTSDGTTRRLYVNGTESWSAAGTENIVNELQFGARANVGAPGTEPFAGAYDHIRVYDRGLSAGEVSALASELGYPVRGTITGLSGTVTLLNNGGDPVSVSADGSFAFSAPLGVGQTYNVTVGTQPASLGLCSVDGGGSGTMSAAGVNDVVVNCTGTTSKRVFVTSQSFDGHLQGSQGADTRCATAASTAGLPGVYRAWVGIHNGYSPAVSFTRSSTPYVRTDGVQVASSWADLTDGTLSAPINRDENGTQRDTVVWTAVNTDGTHQTTVDCSAWGNSAGSATGLNGNSSATNAGWTAAGGTFCNSQLALFCFQQ